MNAVHIKKKGDEITIEFKSKSFLQNQVRSMVGSLEYLSCGKWTLNDFKKGHLNLKKDQNVLHQLQHAGFILKM